MVRKAAFKAAIIGYILIIVSFFIDESFASLVDFLKQDSITSVMHFVTDFGIILLGAIIGVTALLRKKYRFILFMALSAVIALEAAFLLKMIFQVPRPYVLGYDQPLLLASGYAFPSMHTAVMCSLIPFQKYLFGKKSLSFIYLFLGAVIFSRMYLGVHSLSDIMAGMTIGLVSTYAILSFEKQYGFVEWFNAHITDKFELRRQIMHLLTGSAIVLLLKLQLMNAQLLFIITFLGGILVLVVRKIHIPVIHKILEYFERPHHMAKFPGRGSFFLVLGAAAVTLIFKPQIAMAAIMIMAVGDSVTNIVGRHFGKILNPFNAKKNLEGTASAVVCATLAAIFFVPFWPAFVASLASMALESIDLGVKKFQIEIDDNVMIPLVAGVVMTAMMG